MNKRQKNAKAEVFLEKMIAACSRFPVTPETKAIYLEKLSKWQLTQDRWDAALDNLISENPEGLPTLGQIYPYLKGISDRDAPMLHWITFDLDGVRYAMKCQNPMNPPEAPLGAVNVRNQPDPRYITNYKQCTLQEAREAFRQGFLEACGDPAKLESYFKAIFAPTEPQPDDEVPF